MIVMAAGTLVIPQKSPYIVRTSFALPQQTAPIALWAAKHGIKKVFTLVTDYGPGIDAETTFKTVFTANGGIVDSARVPLNNPDYAPFIQRAKDDKPDAVFIFVPSGEGAAVMKQFAERGLAKAGIKLIGTGDVVDDDILDSMGDPAIGTITSHFYSAAHPSAENKAYVAAFEKANAGMRPNFMSVGGYDGMALIYQVLKKTGGSADGDKFVAAAEGLSWTSPRGKITIDPTTRDVIQDVYLRKVERVNGHLYNVEFDRVRDVHPDGKYPRRPDPPSAERLDGAGSRRERLVLTVLFDGIATGALLFMLALGLSVTLGIMNFVNLAHGAFAMLGGYVAVVLLKDWGVPLLWCLPAAFLIPAAVGMVLERTLYVRLYGASPLDQVLFTIGIVFASMASPPISWNMGRPPALTRHQREEALRDLAKGKATQADLARRFNVNRSAISRLRDEMLPVIVDSAAAPAKLARALPRRATRNP